MLKLASLLDDDRRVVGVVHAQVRRPRRRRPRGGVIGGRRYSRRVGAGATATPLPPGASSTPAARPADPVAASGKSVMRSPVTGVGGGPAKTDDTGAGCSSGDGTSCRTASRALRPPRSVVAAPDTGVASARVRRACSIAAAPAEAAGAASALPRFRAPRPNGASSSRTGRSSAITSPASRIPRKTMNAPSGLTRRLTKVASTLPIRPPERPSSMPPSARSAIRASVAA